MVIYNAYIPCLGGVGYVVIEGEHIKSVSLGEPSCRDCHGRAVDARGLTMLPGAIDIHVHFREPGMTHKATMATESRAALAGGVTSFVDMPNTVPQTVDVDTLHAKMDIAGRESVANYGFYIGATGDNLSLFPTLDYSEVAGVKLFMGSSTGGMLLDSDYELSRLFDSVPRDIVITVHAEDNKVIAEALERVKLRYGQEPPVWTHTLIRPAEACVRATERVMNIASRYGARLHVAHVSTAAEMSLFDKGDITGKRITCEVSPHHLLWCDQDYATRGARIKMNPAVKSTYDREALRQGVLDGRVDVIATDHAPHLLSEKQGSALTAVSGAPMVQFSVPAMLDMFGCEAVERLMATNPARLLGIQGRGRLAPGMCADLVLVDTDSSHVVTDNDVVSLCGWTPLGPDTVLNHRVVSVMINGRFTDDGSRACPLVFNRTGTAG